MTKPGMSQVLFWALAAVTVALFGFFVALVAGAIPIGDPAPPVNPSAAVAVRTETTEKPAPTTVRKPARRTTPATTTTAARPAAALATVVITAARGDCWILARLGSETGRVLEERVLAQGESVRLRGTRVWLSIGAAANVDVTVNGEQRELQSGSFAVVLGPT